MPTRLFGGEGVETYSRRAAARNGIEARWIEKALRDMDIVRSVSPRHPTRLQAWRELGGLRDDAFVMPDTIGGDWVTDRFFCRACTAGMDIRGRAPHIGLVCVRHKRWLGITEQPGVHELPALLSAERHYRSKLASRSVLFDSPAMRIGAECARVALSPATIQTRQDQSGLPLDAVLYPEQVAFARIAVRPSLLAAAVDAATEPVQVRTVLDRECRRVVPDDGLNEPWRASTRLQTIMFAVRALALDVTASVPDRWNLLRHRPR